MAEKITTFLKHYLKLRIAHPLVAVLLLICISGMTTGAANCSEICTLNALANEHTRSIAMDDSCCAAGGRMSCCEPSKSENDRIAGSQIKLRLQNFVPVLPTIASAPDFSAVAFAQVMPSSHDRLANSAMQPTRLYILHRSLLI
jgi:hypothetical protein